METGREMKALLILALMVLAAATALAYGRAELAAGVALVTDGWKAGEPAALLLSGSALLGLGGALKRFTI